MIKTREDSLLNALYLSWEAWIELCKIMLPVAALTTYLQINGLLKTGAVVLAPVMHWLNLPVEMGVVWFMAIFVNIYAAIAAFTAIISSGQLEISIAQGSVLGAIILFAHGLPVEGAILRKGGIPILQSSVLRLGAALLYGKLLTLFYQLLGWFGSKASFSLQSGTHLPDSVQEFLVQQFYQLAILLMILVLLNVGIWSLRRVGFFVLIQKSLEPLLSMLQIEKSASGIVLVGLTMGISYGSGLLFAEVKSGKLDMKQAKRALIFLALFHSVIEDSLLVLLFGGELLGVVFFRFIFCFALIWLGSTFVERLRTWADLRENIVP